MLALRHLSKVARGALFEVPSVACGMMQADAFNLTQSHGVASSVYNVGAATNIKFHDGMVPRNTKEAILNQKGVVVWFTGTT